MRTLISHSDFHYVAEISKENLINVQKLRKYHTIYLILSFPSQ